MWQNNYRQKCGKIKALSTIRNIDDGKTDVNINNNNYISKGRKNSNSVDT